MTLIIGFGNKARHGKDGAASAIVDYYERRRFYHAVGAPGQYITKEYKVVRLGFADALYEVARNDYNMTEKDASLLQKVGHQRRVLYGENYWVDQLAAKIKPEHDIVVIPDMRYWNEAEWIKSKGGWTQNITRLNADGTLFVDPSRPADHISEIALDNWNWDGKWIIGHGHTGLKSQLAITLAEYLRGLHS